MAEHRVAGEQALRHVAELAEDRERDDLAARAPRDAECAGTDSHHSRMSSSWSANSWRAVIARIASPSSALAVSTA